MSMLNLTELISDVYSAIACRAHAPVSVLATPKGRKKDGTSAGNTTPKCRKNDENDIAESGGPSPLPNHLRQTLTPKAINIKDDDKVRIQSNLSIKASVYNLQV